MVAGKLALMTTRGRLLRNLAHEPLLAAILSSRCLNCSGAEPREAPASPWNHLENAVQDQRPFTHLSRL